jgi:hypothetical protein
MANTVSTPTFRRFALYGLILLALALSSAVIFVLVTDEPALTSDEAFPSQVVLDPEKHPRLVFPEQIRSYNLEVNRFIDRFARVCLGGDYFEFRMMLSRKQPPILPDRFESNFSAVKEIRITHLEKLPPMPQADAPLYLMQVEYELNDFAVKKGERTKQVTAAILKEEGEYRLGPLPSGAAEKLAAYRAQKAKEEAEKNAAPTTTQSAATPTPPAQSKIIVNGPARIGP